MHRRVALIAALATSLLASAGLASPAFAADSIYWGSYPNPGTVPPGAIRVGSLTGTGAQTVFPGENRPQGIAIDAAAGKIYWGSTGTNAIRVANLDGTGAHDLFIGESQVSGVAIDPVAGKLYWAAYGAGKIRAGNLDGTGAHDLFSGD